MLIYFTSQHNFTAIEGNEAITITDDTETEIEKVLDNTTTDLHVGQTAAKSQGNLQFTIGHSLLHNAVVCVVDLSLFSLHPSALAKHV